uniref:DUF202 domain-containing protein n=1 Tax=Steinernema glaseri TaxID=37863 RepID=A0A1I7ZYI3_9BILA
MHLGQTDATCRLRMTFFCVKNGTFVIFEKKRPCLYPFASRTLKEQTSQVLAARSSRGFTLTEDLFSNAYFADSFYVLGAGSLTFAATLVYAFNV